MTDTLSQIDLSTLTPRQRLVVVLHYYLDWTYSEIAQAVGAQDFTVRKHASDAVCRLRRNNTGEMSSQTSEL